MIIKKISQGDLVISPDGLPKITIPGSGGSIDLTLDQYLKYKTAIEMSMRVDSSIVIVEEDDEESIDFFADDFLQWGSPTPKDDYDRVKYLLNEVKAVRKEVDLLTGKKPNLEGEILKTKSTVKVLSLDEQLASTKLNIKSKLDEQLASTKSILTTDLDLGPTSTNAKDVVIKEAVTLDWKPKDVFVALANLKVDISNLEKKVVYSPKSPLITSKFKDLNEVIDDLLAQISAACTFKTTNLLNWPKSSMTIEEVLTYLRSIVPQADSDIKFYPHDIVKWTIKNPTAHDAINELREMIDEHDGDDVQPEVTSTALKAGVATPIELIAEKGANLAIFIESIEVTKPAGTAYTVPGGADLSIQYGTGEEILKITSAGFLDQAGLKSRKEFPRSYEVVLNQPINLKVLGAAELTNGTSDLIMVINYRIKRIVNG